MLNFNDVLMDDRMRLFIFVVVGPSHLLLMLCYVMLMMFLMDDCMRND